MEWQSLDIKKEISLGEDSSRQFKSRIDKASSFAEELCAMSNSQGGVIYIGVADDGNITGLSTEEIAALNQLVSNVSNENVKPAIYPQTKTIEVDGKRLMLVYVPKGPSKPYCTSNGVYWVKSGSDKRKASPAELLRMFQQSQLMYLDESPTSATVTIDGPAKTIEPSIFKEFYENSRGKPFDSENISIERAFENMNLAKEGHLTLAGLLLFGVKPQRFKPFCLIRAVRVYGTEISDVAFQDKNDCMGTLSQQFDAAMFFIKNNLHRMQVGEGFNQPGVLEINERALEEAVVNALLHRDYAINAVIRTLVFDDRVEIISPGSLPNHLTVANIINGNSVIRNPTIVSFATKMLPYSGIGSGIARILKYHPDTTFIDDKEGEQFITVFRRPVKER